MPGGAPRNRVKLLAPLIGLGRWLWIGGAVAGLAIAGAAAAWMANTSDEAPAAAAPAAAATPVARPKLSADRVPAIDTIVLLEWEGDPAKLHLLDAHTGAILATADVGYRPNAIFRRSTNEVLVSYQGPVTADNPDGHVLDVLDANNGLALTRRINAPYRADTTVGAPAEWRALSRDERYYAYGTMTFRTELTECQGSSDGPSCARSAVNIVDLEHPDLPPWQYEVPRYFLVSVLWPDGPDGIGASCADGRSFQFRPGQPVIGTSGPTPRFQTEPVNSHNLATTSFVVSTEDGWVGNLMSYGWFVWTRAGSRGFNDHAVPDGMQLRWPLLVEVGGGRLVAGYAASTSIQYPEGLSIFNMAAGTIERTLGPHNIGRSMVATGPDTLLAVTRDGRLIEINVNTDDERTLTTPTIANPEDVVLLR